MAINLITKTKTKIRSLKTSDGSNIVEVYRSPSTADWLPANTRVLTANSFVKNFRLYCQLEETFPAIDLPDIEITDTKMQQNIKVVNAYWGGARKQLNIYLAESGTDWVLLGQVSLVRVEGYPYQLISLMDTLTENIAIELGMDSAIGVSVTPVNHGGIADGDILNLIGSVVEEYSITTVYHPVIYQNLNTLIGTAPTKILPVNSNRKSFRVTNQSNSIVFLSLSESTNPVFAIQLQPNGDFYHHSEMESQYTGSVWAHSWAANSNLLIMEGV